MKRLALVLLLSAGLFFASRPITPYLAAATAPSPKAFTADGVEKRYRPDGQIGVSVLFTHARRGDGSTVTVFREFDPAGDPLLIKRITDLKSKKRITANSALASITSTSMSDAETAFEKERASRCYSQNTGETRVLFNLKTYRVQFSTPTHTVTSWASPDLACYPFILESAKRLSDGRQVVTTREVVHFSFGEPAASLFEVEAWPEMDPIQLNDVYLRKYEKPLFPPDALNKAQTHYLRQK
jgi:hypothetical protein